MIFGCGMHAQHNRNAAAEFTDFAGYPSWSQKREAIVKKKREHEKLKT